MLIQLFSMVICASLAGGVLTLILLLLKPVTKRWFGAAWQYYIWLAVLLVLLVPLRFGIANSPSGRVLQAEDVQPQQVTAAAENAALPSGAAPNTAAPDEPAVQRPAMLAEAADTIGGHLGIISMIWVAGMLAILCIRLISYHFLVRSFRRRTRPLPCPEIRRFTDRPVPVRIGSGFRSPFLIGLLHPTLYLPDTPLSEAQFENMLRHELMHVKRRDLWFKWLAFFVRCVHWFNPAVYLATRQINEACEISCDLAVTAQMDPAQEAGYMNTILAVLSQNSAKNIPLTTAMACGKKQIERRFTMIRNRKKIKKTVVVVSIVLAVILFSATVYASGILGGLASPADTPYRNGALGFTLTLPADWQGKYTVIEYPTQVSFLQTATYNKYGEGSGGLFYIERLDGQLTQEQIDFPGNRSIAMYANGYTYVLGTPTDVQYPIWAGRDAEDVAIAAQYEEMFAGIEQIKASIAPYSESVTTDTVRDTVSAFFSAFEQSNFDEMKQYCTPDCIDGFFGSGYVFGMQRAKLTNLTIDPTEYAKSSNDFIVQVDVEMQSAPGSVYAEGQTQTSFYLILLRQEDGSYRINEFATGL